MGDSVSQTGSDAKLQKYAKDAASYISKLHERIRQLEAEQELEDTDENWDSSEIRKLAEDIEKLVEQGDEPHEEQELQWTPEELEEWEAWREERARARDANNGWSVLEAWEAPGFDDDNEWDGDAQPLSDELFSACHIRS